MPPSFPSCRFCRSVGRLLFSVFRSFGLLFFCFFLVFLVCYFLVSGFSGFLVFLYCYFFGYCIVGYIVFLGIVLLIVGCIRWSFLFLLVRFGSLVCFPTLRFRVYFYFRLALRASRCFCIFFDLFLSSKGCDGNKPGIRKSKDTLKS